MRFYTDFENDAKHLEKTQIPSAVCFSIRWSNNPDCCLEMYL